MLSIHSLSHVHNLAKLGDFNYRTKNYTFQLMNDLATCNALAFYSTLNLWRPRPRRELVLDALSACG